MTTKIARIIGGTLVAGALCAFAPAGLAFADDVVNPPTDSLNHGQLNAVVNINKTPRSMGWDVRQQTMGWDVRQGTAGWDVRTHGGIGNNNALIGLLRPAPTR